MSNRDETQFFADRVPPAELAASQRDPESIKAPDEPRTFLELVSAYGAKMAAAERQPTSTAATEAADLFAEIGRRYRAAQALTTYTDRATVMETLDGVA